MAPNTQFPPMEEWRQGSYSDTASTYASSTSSWYSNFSCLIEPVTSKLKLFHGRYIPLSEWREKCREFIDRAYQFVMLHVFRKVNFNIRQPRWKAGRWKAKT